MKIFYLILFFFSFNSLFASDIIDLKEVFNLRTQQYSTGKYKNICIVSPGRTGSTLVYNIARILFENKNDNRKVFKYHTNDYKSIKNSFFIFTIKNPLDACFSTYRVLNKTDSDIRNNIKKIVNIKMQQFSLYQNFTNIDNALILRYEDFIDDTGFIINKIEEKFYIKVNASDRELVSQALSKENVLKNIEQYENFDDFDPGHQFHGDHIDNQQISEQEKKMILEQIFEELKKHISLINRCGYSLEDISPNPK